MFYLIIIIGLFFLFSFLWPYIYFCILAMSLFLILFCGAVLIA